MSELKLPVLGFGGILQLCQPLPPNEHYRQDIGNEHDLIRYLSKNKWRIVDPYPGPVEAIH
jgi:hypothetical protein